MKVVSADAQMLQMRRIEMMRKGQACLDSCDHPATMLERYMLPACPENQSEFASLVRLSRT